MRRLLRVLSRLGFTATVVVLAVLAYQVGSNLAKPQLAEAGHGLNANNCIVNPASVQKNRCQWFGFFTGLDTVYGGTADVFDGGGQPDDYTNVNSAAQFISKVETNLNKNFDACSGIAAAPPAHPNDPYPWPSCFMNKADAIQAAFFVNTMLGRRGFDYATYNGSGQAVDTNPAGNTSTVVFNNVEGINWAKQNINQWKYVVNWYNDHGLANFNLMVNYSCVTGGQKPSWNVRLYGHDMSWIYNCSTGKDLLGNTIPTQYESIRFYIWTGSAWDTYDIVKFCANAKGSLPDLRPPVPEQDVQGRFEQPANPTYSPPADAPYPVSSTVALGKKYTVGAQARNFGDGSAPNTYLNVKIDQNPGYVSNVGHSDNGFSGQYNNGGGFAQSNVGGPSVNCYDGWPCWIWNYPDGALTPAGTGRDRAHTAFSFQVTSNPAAVGQQICFKTFVHYQNPNLENHVGTASNGGRVCYTIAQPTAPYFTTQNGSLHAGSRFDAQPCFEPSITSGGITGTLKVTGGKADYVASAGGSINGFGSGGSPSGSALTFGNNPSKGRYGRVCRTDVAEDVLSDHKYNGNNVPSDNRNTLAASAINDGISYHDNGNNVTITGGNININKRGTLVVKGDVYITGNITFSTNSYTISTIPSFGIIATGNILIDPSVSQLYGMYSAGSMLDTGLDRGVINTCRNGFSAIGANNLPNPPDIITNAGACNRGLVVQGALIANNIYFRRTCGDANNPATACPSTGTSAAETISYIPQLTLNPPEGFGGVANQIRSDGERPPVF